jgi:predicted RNA-binding Zn ribbon-like protein
VVNLVDQSNEFMPKISTASQSLAPELPFQYVGGDPALDLVNTVDWTSRGPEEDRLTDFERLTRWAEGAGILSSRVASSLRSKAQARPREAEAAHRTALRARAVLQRLFSAMDRGEKPDDALDDFNQLLGKSLERMRVTPVETRRRDQKLQLGWQDAGTSLESLIWPVLWSAARLIVSDEAPQIRTCGGADCGWMYVDRSRNGLRRWCQMATCGTREKSRRRRGGTAVGR